MTEHPPIPWDLLSAERPERRMGVRDVIEWAAPILWRAWTEGRAVVEKPEPDDTDEDGHPVWSLPGEHGGDELIAIAGDFGPPFVLVSSTCEMLQAASARHRGASFLAAADRAEQLARQQANKDDPTGSGREPAARAPVQREGRAAGFEGDIRPDGETYNAARDPNVGQELQRTCDALGITAEQARVALLQRHEQLGHVAEPIDGGAR